MWTLPLSLEHSSPQAHPSGFQTFDGPGCLTVILTLHLLEEKKEIPISFLQEECTLIAVCLKVCGFRVCSFS